MGKKIRVWDGTIWQDVAAGLPTAVSTLGGSEITVSSGSTVPLTIQNNGTGDSFVVNDESSDTTPFTITAAGNVGIGATPTNLLTVIGSTSGQTVAAFANNNTGVNAVALRSGATGGNWANTLALQNYTGSTTYAEVRASADSQMGLFTNGSERMRIDSAGNVAIGATSLASKLGVVGTSSNQSSALGVIDSNTVSILTTAGAALNIKTKLSFGLTDASVYGYSTVAGYYASYNGANDIGTGLIFGTQFNAAGGTVERMRIDSTGRIQIPATGVLEAPLVQNAQSASYTSVLADAGKLVEMNVANANNLTVPLNSSVAYPIGTQINILQVGVGQTTVVATGGVTINSTPGLKLRAQWSSATLIKRAENTWVLVGDLSA